MKPLRVVVDDDEAFVNWQRRAFHQVQARLHRDHASRWNASKQNSHVIFSIW